MESGAGIMAFMMLVGTFLAVGYSIWLFFFPIMIIRRLNKLIELAEKK